MKLITTNTNKIKYDDFNARLTPLNNNLLDSNRAITLKSLTTLINLIDLSVNTNDRFSDSISVKRVKSSGIEIITKKKSNLLSDSLKYFLKPYSLSLKNSSIIYTNKNV